MDKISLNSVIPNIFLDAGELNSGIWGINTYFERGRRYLIEAESGKGKSSFCSFVYGQRFDYSGSIHFDDQSIKQIVTKEWDSIRTSHLSLLFQDLGLFPELTALENVMLKNRLTKYKSKQEIKILFDRFGIADKLNQKVELLSWGQKQRVAIIRCSCQPFDFLLMDEPISHLDDRNSEIVAQFVQEEAQQQGAAIIVTSIGKHLPLDYSKTISL